MGRRSYQDINEQLENGLRILRNLYVVFGISRKNVSILLTQKSNNIDANGAIKLATDFFWDVTLKESEKLDIFIGEFTHEVSHFLHTNFELIENKVKANELNASEFSILNILEDERIERVTTDGFPGYSNYLSVLKMYYFEKRYLEEKALFEKQQKNTPIKKSLGYMDALLKFVRFPSTLEDEEKQTFEQFLDAVYDILKEYPKSTEECMVAAKEIYALIKEDVKNEAEEKVGEELSKKGNYSGASKQQIVDAVEKSMLDSVDAGGAAIDKVFASGINKMQGLSNPANASSNHFTSLLKAQEHTNKILTKQIEFGSDENIRFIRSSSNGSGIDSVKHMVAASYSAISTYLKREHRDYRLELKNMKSGYLDSDKLVEAVQGVETVYKRYGVVKSEKITLVLLIDESGSMSSNSESNNYNSPSKVVMARAASLTIWKAVEGLRDVDLYVYGYSSEGNGPKSTEIYVYKEKEFGNINNLGSTNGRRYTHEGVAVKEVVKRVRKFTDANAVLFVISDGCPEGTYYSGDSAIDDTREQVKKATKEGFDVVHVAITEDAASVSPQMYKHYVDFSLDPKKLPQKLIMLMKKLVGRKIRSKMTI